MKHDTTVLCYYRLCLAVCSVISSDKLCFTVIIEGDNNDVQKVTVYVEEEEEEEDETREEKFAVLETVKEQRKSKSAAAAAK